MNTEPVHLLIVEDEAAHVEAIRRAFEAAGSRAEIRAVGTLREYREELAASPPDLALVDLNLADGRAVEILTHPPESAPFPILVMTAFGTEQIVVEVMKAGALDYVVKSPETFAGMPQTAARVLREWRLLQKHRQAEAALAASEKRHRAIIDGSPVPLAVNDGQQRITYLNRAFVATFGFTLEDIPTLADWWPKAYPDPQYRKSMEDTWNVRLEQAKQTGNPFVPLEAEVRCKDGTIRSILAGMAPLDDGDNEGEHLVVLYDITERKQAEEQLREQEESYRTLADSGRALIWTAGTDKKCNYFNQPWLKFTGRTREQELGDGWAEGVHPDDLARCFKIYAEAFDRRESFSMDYRLRHHTGEFRWIQDDGTPRHDRRGNFIGYIGHCIDITERKQAEDSLRESEARMRDIVFSMADWVWETDENGRYTYSSQKGKDWFGRVLGKTPFDFMPPDEAK
ncbi:MAG: PAS domain S-box protein, partial [Verrucomicrobiota bacterium]